MTFCVILGYLRQLIPMTTAISLELHIASMGLTGNPIGDTLTYTPYYRQILYNVLVSIANTFTFNLTSMKYRFVLVVLIAHE